MKMHAPEAGFVDGRYAKFYSLSSELLRVGSKAIAPLQDLIPSILPKQSRGEKKAASIQSRIADCPRPMRRLRENESLEPGVRIHHGRTP